VNKETPKTREKSFMCMFCGHAGYLDEFAFIVRELKRCFLSMVETHIVMGSFSASLLGHLSFDFLCRLSGLVLIQELSLLKFESNLICVLYHYCKMITDSHSPINTVMTGQLR
jgi:hypothetical protein